MNKKIMIRNKIRTILNTGKQKLLSKKDEVKLKNYDSIFRNYRSISKKLEEKIEPAYKEYVNKVSTPEMAVSLQTAVLLYYLSHKKHPKRILDLGSGFSSYILRLYKQEQKEHVEVYSVDDNKEWLEKTKEFLYANKLSYKKVVELDEFGFSSYKNSFDLIFHDLGSMNVRKKYLLDAVYACRLSRGIIVLDDIHKKNYSNFVKSQLDPYPHKFFNLNWITRDDFGREAALITSIK